jgi:hypothetical protein
MIAIADIFCQGIFYQLFQLLVSIHNNKAKEEHKRKTPDFRGF